MLRFKKKPIDGEQQVSKLRASKVTQDGIKFDSKLELYLYNLLRSEGLKFDFQVRYVIQQGFTYMNEKIRPIEIVPDFVLHEHKIIIDTKGFETPDSKIKFKMLKALLLSEGKEYRIVKPTSQKKCRWVVEQIQQGYFTLEEPLSDAMAKSRKNKLVKAGFEWENDAWFIDVFRFYAGYVMSLDHYDFEQLLLKYQI